MAHARKFRFGIQISSAPTAEAWAGLARQTEDLGFDTLFVPDHFEDQLAPAPAMMAAADATTDLKVGCLVYDNDYRHPVILAKEAATLDVLTGGRTELGMGAGWMRTDYDQSGIPYDDPAVRVDRLEEGVAVVKGLFADGPFSFQGEHYTITELDGLPKPAQRPGPPLIIGGGRPRVLRLAGREADIVGISSTLRAGEIGPEAAADSVADQTDKKVAWVREAAGDRFEDIELNVQVAALMVTDDQQAGLEAIAPLYGLDTTTMADVPNAWIGSVEQLAEQAHARRDRWGVSYYVFMGVENLEAAAPLVAALRGS
jgi:probable F420-dependent oxidoreductase